MIKMRALFSIVFAMIATAIAENDESWTWNDDRQKTSRDVNARYLVHEPSEHLDSFDNGVHLGFRPQNPGPYGPNSRPLVPGYQSNNGVLVGPGGPTGIIGRPPRFEPNGHDGILDSVPPWIRDDPRYSEFDTCKCRYSFNCPSPGLKFGHCAREKKYCCFNSKRFPGLSGGHQYPYYPGAPHKHRPNGFAPTSNYYGNRRPYSGYQHPSFGDYHSRPYNGGYGHRNEFEPYGYDPELDDYVIYERSLGKNQTQTNEKPETYESTER
ncbi:PREDICTED: uncharacterized protein LOC105561786 [Vollenhovia emeryi]|uniref:uncharacterized protein LOC105561786 n=1 Tax=Vollenhovia emeryi TaxID=411798 RepID=UPI0005F38BFF|nr:PREDICTED: uncharacterized protein LOC105561786 [Vollenhovia emeryi]XP_011867485.1 PREDICTED: uncharacterized protein LOC105561786 [Vollenhovia emeryi]XP_011867486.1 PREDICTED: uncharacterized protein LOC105561786 [Vollenhovia emeryi]